MSGAAPVVLVHRASVTRGQFVISLPDLELAPGSQVALVGENGTGKTSMLRAIAGLEATTSGIDHRIALTEIAFVAARPFLLRGSVLFNVVLPLRSRRGGTSGSAKERERRAMEQLARFGVSDLASRDRRALSEGQIQRVALARALVTLPAVLLLDEPLASLDAEGRALLDRALHEDVNGRGLALVAAAPSQDDLPVSCRKTVLAIARSVGGAK